MKSRSIYWPMIIAISIVLGMYIGSRLNYPAKPVALAASGSKEQKIRQIINYIDYDYVDDVNTDSLLDLTIVDMLHRLDPHSSYIAKQDVQASEESVHGKFTGIGIEYQIYKDTLVVVRVIEGGPSEKAGLKGGDRLIEVNDSLLDISSAEKIGNQLRGEYGSKVKLGVYRRGGAGIQSYQVKRGEIPLVSVDAAYMLTDSIGLIKINRFAETTHEEFVKAMSELKSKGLQKLILDLRDNPGGLLTSANDLADEFLKKGQLIVFTKERSGQKDETFATSKGHFEKGDLVVLINENSASASEIVAGALQDNDRALVVGRRSFGKGLVQEEIALGDGSKIRLTTARYYTPTGRSIQKPYSEGYEAYSKEAEDRWQNGQLFNVDSNKVKSGEQFVTPQGKVVYGGGGIMPDVFVPIDTSVQSLSWFYHYFTLSRIDGFAFNWVDGHRGEFKKMSKSDFIAQWELSDEVYNEFLTYAGADKLAARIDDVTAALVKNRLKALIGRNIWGSSAFYPVMFELDPIVEKAILVLEPNRQVEE